MLAAKVVGHVDKRDTVDAIYDGLLRNEPELIASSGSKT